MLLPAGPAQEPDKGAVLRDISREGKHASRNRQYFSLDTKRWESHPDPLWSRIERLTVSLLGDGKLQLRFEMCGRFPGRTKERLGIQVCFPGDKTAPHADVGYVFGARAFEETEPPLRPGQAGVIRFEPGKERKKERKKIDLVLGNVAYRVVAPAHVSLDGRVLTMTLNGELVGQRPPFHVFVHYHPGIRAAYLSGDFGNQVDGMVLEGYEGQIMLHGLF